MRNTDDNLIHALRNQDSDALSELIEQHGHAVLALATRVLGQWGTAQDAEECAIDVFVAAWHKADTYDPARASLRSWLLLLTKYQALDLRRRLERTGHVETGSSPASASSAKPVEAVVLSRERQDDLTACIRAMDASLRAVFVRRYLLHVSIEEIAAELGLSRTAVDNRLYRGRRWLRNRLEQMEAGGGMTNG